MQKRNLNEKMRKVDMRIMPPATVLPLGTVGSLRPTFISARRVGLAVKLPSAFALEDRYLSNPRKPLHAPYLIDGSAPPEGGLLFFLRLPPKLRRNDSKSISGNSEASKGLSVQVQVVRIFTDMSISPSLSPRPCPDRYAFRADRNLPDNEFCYLRTVMVTAAVHRRPYRF
ncbi:hypothetical protein Cgig2_013805 [Carnegiea gigantea]|uniref:Uncharacterized protein n=1 Tax=Carnegiea gigantea TaxID=171969 RepID=A0A9Q1K3Y3_9CARY|nr:hypothetical protein Cgig2_013805 [Carnegiea gigantea]